MKKILTVMISLFLTIGMILPVSAAESQEPQAEGPKDYLEYLYKLTDDLSDEEFEKLALRNFKFLQSIELIFEEESYQDIFKANTHLKQHKEGARQEFLDAQENLKMKVSVADGVIFLWDKDNIPHIEGENFTEEKLDAAPLDGPDFIPLLVKCLIDNPSEAKGNIIFISGGAGGNRANNAEAYPAIPIFNDLGYNVFVLQYRVTPYSINDTFMDQQRAIRLVRYYAEKEGWGGQDMIAGASWGAGVSGPIMYGYGYLTPADTFAPEYVPDEIDAINSDWDAALSIYGVGITKNCENPNIPAIYMCIGTEDPSYPMMLAQYKEVASRNVPTALHIIEGAGHGFGVGQEGAANAVPECTEWPYEADQFMMVNRGHAAGVEPTGEFTIELPDDIDWDAVSESDGGSSDGESAPVG